MKCKRARAARAKRKRWLARVPIFVRLSFGDWVHEPLLPETPVASQPASGKPGLVVKLQIARVLKSESLPREKARYRKAGFDVVD